MSALAKLDHYETLPARLLDKVLWAKATEHVEVERGPRPVANHAALALTMRPSIGAIASANHALDTLSAGWAWDRAVKAEHARLAKLEGFSVTDSGLVPLTARGA